MNQCLRCAEEGILVKKNLTMPFRSGGNTLQMVVSAPGSVVGLLFFPSPDPPLLGPTALLLLVYSRSIYSILPCICWSGSKTDLV